MYHTLCVPHISHLMRLVHVGGLGCHNSATAWNAPWSFSCRWRARHRTFLCMHTFRGAHIGNQATKHCMLSMECRLPFQLCLFRSIAPAWILLKYH